MSVETVVADAARALDVAVDRYEAMVGGEFNITVLLHTPKGRFVARRPQHHADWRTTLPGQAAAIALARDAGVPVPEVVHVDDGLFVQRFVEGAEMTDAEAVASLAVSAGEIVARMHALGGTGIGPVQPDGSCPGWPTTTYFNEIGDEVERLLHSLADDSPIRRADVEAARDLLADPPPMRSQLVHGDIGPGNIVVRDGAIAAVIDFDNTWWGDAAVDLAWWWWRSPHTAEAFERGLDGDTDAHRRWACRVRLLVGLADVFAARMPDRAAYIGELLPQAIAGLAATR